MTRKMFHLGVLVGAAVLGTAAWTMTARAGYESAEYKVVETDGDIEIREYPDLMLAATSSKLDSQGRDGSFMRLFRYISGNNENDQKIAMTTPVFMEGDNGLSDVSMGFVMPKEVAVEGVPDPKSDGVEIRRRESGRFAVIRFSGRMDSKLAKKQEARLRDWMNARGLEGETTAEAAGYDPPFTPGPLRRNEILIRLKQSSDETPSVDRPMRHGDL
ncbi:SOUL family heme-binding protein [Crateriforma conspicua]|uniref:SOUL family heme-binding protein n=1 Tax=Crateriforma conspicua TaxID=2527996 RepID=UPI00118A6C28|nr:heme-binding protein [Crateriforma conspicua]QDV62305.1 SOUL heme-binding protein [Crateriforma conspicua]